MKQLGEHGVVAKKVWEGERAVPDSDEFARVLAELVSGRGEPKTICALKFRKAALQAVGEWGSSDKDFEELVEKIHLI
ncbi:hypothetical protein Ahy_B10g105188 [Arachis hypogaea]|uniref:Uncharacterized protein n=1 Tax=Arachis hypogaea TaxID=3818 RepID=A0A444X7D9_ARAHY|nr:hypothetical protein Ahy_B10g105188 [Arachis hypogaea]